MKTLVVNSECLKYTNVIHTGNTDMDGLTLFAYGGGGTVVRPQLELQTNRSDICAGGWDENYNRDAATGTANAGGYFYWSTQTRAWVAHTAATDPHIAVLTARLRSGDGPASYNGLSVRFRWTMPGGRNGNGLEETRVVPVDSNGVAAVKVVSGDQLSRDTDSQTGRPLFDEPVRVEATCVVGSQTQSRNLNLNVLEPTLACNYKNERGQYVTLPANPDLLNLNPQSRNVLLQTLVTWNGQPVFGHRIQWSINTVNGKGGEPLPVSAAYGRISGNISTTGTNGAATATFTKGSDYAQLGFSVEDDAFYTWVDEPTTVSQAHVSGSRVSSARFRRPMPRCPTANSTTRQRSRGRKRTTYRTPPYDEYTYVHGPAGYDYPQGYPAPPGYEDNELLANTLSLVRNGGTVTTRSGRTVTTRRLPGLNGLSPESRFLRGNGPDPDRRGDPEAGVGGGWWFSQVVGNDPDSAGTHFADIFIMQTGTVYVTNPPRTITYPRLYGAAFDIVLNQVDVFRRQGRMAQFGPYVKRMRDLGIVAWHRWAGEPRPGSNEPGPGANENEMHCIDPAVPGIKRPLITQIRRFKNNGINGDPGSNGYEREPTQTTNPSLIPFVISQTQIDAVDARFRGPKKQQFARIYSNAVAIPWTPERGPNN